MYVLGIDGGGTKTAVAILDENGNLVGVGVSGPSSVDTVSIETTKNSINEAIRQVISEDNIEIQSVFAGLGGIACLDHEKEVMQAIRDLPYIKKDANIVVKNDVVNALAGGLATRCGIAIIIGTGAVAYGMDELGNTWRSGGYHFKEGDAGSAYDLGFQALKAMARAMDGRFEKTAFTDELQEVLGVVDFISAVKVYDEYFNDRTKTAQLAKLVTKYADLGNLVALNIVETATDELALLIKAVDNHLQIQNKEVAIIGGLGNADTIYKKRFIEKVKMINSNFHVHQFLLDPVIGAALMALKNTGTEITDELINRLK